MPLDTELHQNERALDSGAPYDQFPIEESPDAHALPPGAPGETPHDAMAPKLRESLSKYLQRLHKTHGTKIWWVAEKIGISRVNYSRIVHGKSGASKRSLVSLAHVWRVPEDYFLRFEDRYSHDPIPLRTIVQDETLLRKFIEVPVDRETFEWFARNLGVMAEQVDKWEAYHKKKKELADRRLAEARQAAARAREEADNEKEETNETMD